MKVRVGSVAKAVALGMVLGLGSFGCASGDKQEGEEMAVQEEGGDEAPAEDMKKKSKNKKGMKKAKGAKGKKKK